MRRDVPVREGVKALREQADKPDAAAASVKDDDEWSEGDIPYTLKSILSLQNGILAELKLLRADQMERAL